MTVGNETEFNLHRHGLTVIPAPQACESTPFFERLCAAIHVFAATDGENFSAQPTGPVVMRGSP
jgi:hypothetical protein